MRLSEQSKRIVENEMEKISIIYEDVLLQNNEISSDNAMSIALTIYIKHVDDMQFIEEYDE